MQDTEGDLYDSKDRDNIRSEKTVEGYQTSGKCSITSSCIDTKYKQSIPEFCRGSDDRHRRLGRVLEQKPINDGV